MVVEEQAQVVRASWVKLIERGGKEFYHAHGGRISLEQVEDLLTQ
jgi:hypothetical protein